MKRKNTVRSLRILLIANTPNGTSGIDEYLKCVVRALKQNGTDFKIIYIDTFFGQKLKDPFRSIFHILSMIYIPILSKVYKADICHFTVDQQNFSIPFIACKKIVTRHHTKMFDGEFGRYFTFTVKVANKLSVKFADSIIAISEQTEKELLECGRTKNNVTIISRSVPSKFQPNEKLRKNIVFGYIGTITLRKDVHIIVDVANEMKTAYPMFIPRFEIYGRGDLSKDVQNKIDVLELSDRVFLMGELNEEIKVEIYNSFTAFVFPTRFEGFGLPILEAETCGIPVIIKESAEIPSNVSEACIKCPDTKSMSAQLHRLATDDLYRTECSMTALEHSKKFSPAVEDALLIDIYTSISKNS